MSHEQVNTKARDAVLRALNNTDPDDPNAEKGRRWAREYLQHLDSEFAAEQQRQRMEESAAVAVNRTSPGLTDKEVYSSVATSDSVTDKIEGTGPIQAGGPQAAPPPRSTTPPYSTPAPSNLSRSSSIIPNISDKNLVECSGGVIEVGVDGGVMVVPKLDAALVKKMMAKMNKGFDDGVGPLYADDEFFKTHPVESD